MDPLRLVWGIAVLAMLGCSSGPRASLRAEPNIDGALAELQGSAGLTVELERLERFSGGGPCEPSSPRPSVLVLDPTLEPSAGASIVWLRTSAGRFEQLAVAPDGQRARALVAATADADEGSIDLIVRAKDGQDYVHRVAFFAARGFAFLERSQRDHFVSLPDYPSEPNPGGMGCDPPSPPPPVVVEPGERFGDDGGLQFARFRSEAVGWASAIRFAVGVQGAVDGAVLHPERASCDLGQLRLSWGRPDADELPGGWLQAEFVPFEPSGMGSYTVGEFWCELEVQLERPGEPRERYEARLRGQVFADGRVGFE